MLHIARGGATRFLCRSLFGFFNRQIIPGLKSPAYLLLVIFENMGGVYAAVSLPFGVKQDRDGVRTSLPCPGPDRQDAGQG